MCLVVAWIEIMIKVALFVECRLSRWEKVELELRIPLNDMLLKALRHITIRSTDIVNVEHAIFRRPKCIRPSGNFGDDTRYLTCSEAVRSAEA